VDSPHLFFKYVLNFADFGQKLTVIISDPKKTFKQILRVTWTDKRTNDWVLKKAGTEPSLLQSIKSRKESFLIMVMCYGKKETGERNNARYCIWSKKTRKTQNTLTG